MTQFASALEESNILDNVETIPGITVFAYRNGDGDFNISAAGLVLNDTVEYTPTLDSGRAYTTVAGSTITPVERSGAWFVNGRRIVKANIPIMNGVLHILENVVSKSILTLSSWYTDRFRRSLRFRSALHLL